MKLAFRFHSCALFGSFFLILIASIQAQSQTPDIASIKSIVESDTTLEAKLHAQLEFTKIYSRIDDDSAVYYADKSLNLAVCLNNDSLLASAKNNKAVLLMSQAKYADALQMALQALELYEKIGARVMAGRTEDNIGNIFYVMQQFDDAKVYYSRALKTRVALGDSLGIAVSHLNMGSLYNRAGEQEKAIQEHLKALTAAKQIGHDELIGMASNNIGLALMTLDRFAEAKPYVLQSEAIYKKTDNKYRLGNAYNNMATLQLADKNYDAAISYINKSLKIGLEMNAPKQQQIAYDNFVLVYEAKGDFSKAIFYLKRKQKLADSIASTESLDNVAKYQVRYETDRLTREKMAALSEKNEVANALVVQQAANVITQLKLARNYYIIAGLLLVMLLLAIIFVVLQMRSKLKAEVKTIELKQSILQAHMNPHFIFNALNSIQNQILNRDRKDAYEYHSKFSELMRTVLEASSREAISLEEEVDAIHNYLALEQLRTDDKFDFKISVDSQLDQRTTFVPPLLVQPFAENAVWHGLINKEGKGHLQIDISGNSQHIHYLISDDGVGRTRAAEINQMKTKDHESRGVNVTSDRVRYYNMTHGRNLEINITDLVNAEGNPYGTSVEIDIPHH